MQAGASAGGVALAGKIADMVFAQTLDMTTALQTRQRLSDAAQAAGRDPASVRLLPGLSLYLGDTRAEARELFLANHQRVDRAQRIDRIRAALGIDLADWPSDRPVTPADLQNGESARNPGHGKILRDLIAREAFTVDQLLERPETLASVHWQIIGTVDDAVSTISQWFNAGAIDGFVAVPGGSAKSLDLTLEQLLPRLAEAGLFRAAYSGETLAAHLDEA